MRPEKEKPTAKRFDKRIILLILLICTILAVLSIPFWLKPAEEPVVETTVPTTAPTTAPPTTAPTVTHTEAATEPSTEPVMLEDMAALYEQNPDFAAWVKIDDTVIDFPVMFTPEDEEKYIYANFEGNYDWNGLPFVNKDCSFDPETQNILVYAHNKVYGGMFHELLEYDSEEYWQEHRYITFKTLYEERTYEVFAAFSDIVYLKTDDVFKFYEFIDPQTEEEFNEGVAYFRENTLYETDIKVEYGDRLLTLITCSYRHKYGRYVVVAKEVTVQ